MSYPVLSYSRDRNVLLCEQVDYRGTKIESEFNTRRGEALERLEALLRKLNRASATSRVEHKLYNIRTEFDRPWSMDAGAHPGGWIERYEVTISEKEQ